MNQFRADRSKDLPFLPEWCFLPLASAYAIVSAEAEAQGIDILGYAGYPLLNDVGIICALAAWRATQGVYRFDYQAVINTPITGDLPHDILFNLPEWCVYIETPGLNIDGYELTGFFASLEYDVNENRNELRLVLDYNTPLSSLYSVAIYLGPWPLADALAKTVSEAARQADILGVEYKAPTAEQMKKGFNPLVSLLLYLCSVNGEIGSEGKRPTRPHLFPPMQPKTWDVGVRMGAAMA